ncbi:competence type IV pilus assembly protein ComGB [Bacillus salitolerans]|uniref:Competence type IV pilus assembly protein ComGB n=1 Tax=Bacillus salitolerans TaxID=1437434 RepID=A0ABW4LMY6_9BACI
MRKRLRAKWKLEDQAKLLKQLSTLLERGYPLLEGLMFLTLHLPPLKRRQIDQAIKGMRDGATFHEVLVRLSFHRDILGYLYFAENHGNISFALKEASELLEHKVIYQKQLLKIMQYPIILICITFFLLTISNLFLFPQFLRMFESMNIPETPLLGLILGIVKWFPILTIFSAILLGILFILFWLQFKKTPLTKRIQWLSTLPLYGPIISMFYSQYFAIQLSQLIKGGLSIYESLTVFEKQQHFLLFQIEASQMKAELTNGEALPEIIRNRVYFEEELSKSIEFGVKNGDLSRELFFYSKLSFQKLQSFLQRRMAVVQPLVFLLIGSFIMLLYLAIMQPIFKLLQG